MQCTVFNCRTQDDLKVLWYWFDSHHCKSLPFIFAISFNMKKYHRWKDAPKSLAFKVDYSRGQLPVGFWSDLIMFFGLCSAFDTIHLSMFLGFTSEHSPMVHMATEQSPQWQSTAWEKDHQNANGKRKFLKSFILMTDDFVQWKQQSLIKEMKVKFALTTNRDTDGNDYKEVAR